MIEYATNETMFASVVNRTMVAAMVNKLQVHLVVEHHFLSCHATPLVIVCRWCLLDSNSSLLADTLGQMAQQTRLLLMMVTVLLASMFVEMPLPQAIPDRHLCLDFPMLGRRPLPLGCWMSLMVTSSGEISLN